MSQIHIATCWSKACRSTYSALHSYRSCVQFGQIQPHKNREGNWWNSQTRAFALLLWRCPTKCHCISAGSCRIPIHPAMKHNLVSKAMETNVQVLPWSLQRWTLSLKMIISCLQYIIVYHEAPQLRLIEIETLKTKSTASCLYIIICPTIQAVGSLYSFTQLQLFVTGISWNCMWKQQRLP